MNRMESRMNKLEKKRKPKRDRKYVVWWSNSEDTKEEAIKKAGVKDGDDFYFFSYTIVD